ncbi:MAG: fumarylacetoacetate hydrolase [Streptosporangiales bacterium]|nr:fumarylacetoacetate hydrolase [Streptosporangiales bacterium]
MRIRTVDVAGTPTVCVRHGDRTVRVDRLLDGPPRDLVALLEQDVLGELGQRLAAAVPDDALVDADAPVLAPSARPGKILGIGLNYGAHAGDLGEQAPRTSPASFLKGNHTIAGPDEPIRRPGGIGTVTAEAEVGLVIGRPCYRVSVDEAMSYVAGICAVLDQTAEGVLLENPRYLTRVKNYPTFFTYGPDLITLDEVDAAVGSLDDLRVSTVHNGEVHRTDTVAGMTFSPAELLSFHSHVMPFAPGDVLATGTPGAVPIQPGDRVTCVLGDGFSELTNPVVADA